MTGFRKSMCRIVSWCTGNGNIRFFAWSMDNKTVTNSDVNIYVCVLRTKIPVSGSKLPKNIFLTCDIFCKNNLC